MNKKKIFLIISIVILTVSLSFYIYAREEIRYRVPLFSDIFFKYDEYKLKREIQKHPYSGELHNKLAYLYLKKGDIDQFEKEIKKAIDLNPSEVSYLYSLALHFESKGDYKQAIEMNKTGIKLDKNFRLPFHYNLGRIYRNLGNNEEALKADEEALKHIDTYEIVQGKEFMKNDLQKQIQELKQSEKLKGNQLTGVDYGGWTKVK